MRAWWRACMGKVAAGVCCVALLGAAGCKDEQFDAAQRKEVRKVLQTGVDLGSDPYVQAETLRVLELLKKPSLDHFATKLVDAKDSPMVRVAALRVLLATHDKDIRRLTMARFNNAEVPEQRAILNAVYEYGSPALRRVVSSRALRSHDSSLRLLALEKGPLARLHQAYAAKNKALLEDTIYPELGQLVYDDDPEFAATALKALIECGQKDRAKPFLDQLGDPSQPREKRLAAAHILGRAQVKAAIPLYQKILASVHVSEKGEFVLPKRIDKKMVRAATLGMVACGDPTYVTQAQHYMQNATAEQTIEVLQALGTNPSEDAAISLKIAMQDARRKVRFAAIDLYAHHKRAKADAFIAAMNGTDFDTTKRIARVLAQQFPKQWAARLGEQLDDKASRLKTLELLRDVILTRKDAKVLEPLSDKLYELAASKDKKVSPLAALLLVKVADDPKTQKLLAKVDDPQTRYAYLEYLVRTAPKKNVKFFRKNFLYSDLYAIRLMSAAGMMLAYDAGAKPGKGSSD